MSFSRRNLMQLGAAMLTMPVAEALAAKQEVFDRKVFEAAQAAGLPIIVHVTAPWCPTCKAQKPIVEKLEQSPDYGKLVVFVVDFDSQTDALRYFNAQSQSTLIAFNGKNETARSVGDTDPQSIATLVKSAVSR